jgi:hypothetical protein
MNEEQSGEGRDPKTGLKEDTSAIFLGESSLQSAEEHNKDKNDTTEEVDVPVIPSPYADGVDPGAETGEDTTAVQDASGSTFSGLDTDSTINIFPDEEQRRDS